MDVFARITVRGVFKSCEASATNRRCWRHARSTGASAHREKNMLITKNAANAAAPTPASVTARVYQPLAALMSANARYAAPPTVRFS